MVCTHYSEINASTHVLVLGDSFSWAELVCASVLIRLGTSGVTGALPHVLKDTVGASEVIKMHTLLHIFTGLCIVLGMMMICKLFLQCTKQISFVIIQVSSH
jgi:hypothetical protein